MKKYIITLVVTMLATHLPAPMTGPLSISSLGNGDWQIVAIGIGGLPQYQTVYVLECSTNLVDWTGVTTNIGQFPYYYTNIVHNTNPIGFYKATITYK
jgi:hypothetical protein